MLFRDVVIRYRKTPEWQNLGYRSKIIYENGLRTLEPLYERKIKDISRADIMDMRDELYASRGKCREAFSILSKVMNYAVDREYIEYSPVFRVRLPRAVNIARWENDDIEAFLATAPEHLKFVMLLALYTGQRISDLVKMRWSDYDGDTIKVVQKKTGKILLIPVHPTLKAAVDARRPVADDTGRAFLIWSKQGLPYSDRTLREAFIRHCKRIGLMRQFHGIRKATASILAEMGCSPHEIMAITGHSTLKEVAKYTKQADQVRLARKAVEKWNVVRGSSAVHDNGVDAVGDSPLGAG